MNEVRETHISLVFFVGDRAYKLKKPVSFGFVDLSTREARERICHREVELNRRLAPDVYLGVLDVVDADGRPRDHLVEMRRMPADRRLSDLVGAGEVDCLRAVAQTMTRFHAGAHTSPEISAAATPDAVASLWRENAEEMQRFIGTVFDPDVHDDVGRLARRFIEGRRPLFERRISEGRIRDGHGDLLADDIFCLDDGPRILDCIEFNDRFRWADVLADVAFLAFDLERLGSPEAAAHFLSAYREFSGESYPGSLAHHYIAYRAQIRSKVTALRTEQGDHAAGPEAADLLRIALEHLRRGRVRVVMVGGLPGTGKSTVAGALADELEWGLLRSDEIRKDLVGLPHGAPSPEDFAEGIYGSEVTDRTYGELFRRTKRLLKLGESVICDASWIRREHRDTLVAIAEDTSADLVQLRCVLPPEEAERRLQRRAAEGTDVSDATAAVARRMGAGADPWPDAVAIHTFGPPEAAITAALDEVR